MNAQAVRLHRTGGPDVLQTDAVVVGEPGPGEVRVRQTAIGLNFIDTYHRNGLYPLSLPSGLGLEAAGLVEATGPDVTSVRPGDRVAYCWGPVGAYASHRLIPAAQLVSLPEDIPDEVAATLLLKGCTAEYLLCRCAPPRPGDTVLVHAAAGGVGLVLGQWLAALGITAIGTASSDAKRALARAHGYTHVLGYENVAAQVRDITGGRGAAIVYDGVGKDTWQVSLDSCALRGTLVSFGNASGPVTGVDLAVLSAKGSLYVTRPTLFHYCATADEKAQSAAALFAQIRSGAISARIGQRYPLADAARAHQDMEARRTLGSSLLLP